MKTRPLEPVTPIITPQELSDWLSGLDINDPLLPVICDGATDAIIEYLQLELVNRDREVVYTDWPEIGTGACGLSPCNSTFDADIILPYAGLQSVDFVKVFGDVITDYQIKAATPSQIRFNIGVVQNVENEDAIEIKYTAGFGTVEDVPKAIQIAALNLAAYMYDMRGACGADDALAQSGAKMILRPYKTSLVSI